MKFGYARVSTGDQNLSLQMEALEKAGVETENIYFDKVSGSREDRPQLNELLKILRKGDTLLVWKLDRMARSLIHLVKLVDSFKKKGIGFKSITEPFIDTSANSPHGDLLLNLMGSFAQFEKDLIRERTNAGLASAKRRGEVLGPPRGLSKKAEQKAVLAENYFKSGKLSVEEILEELKISRGTYYKYLRHQGVKTIRVYKKRTSQKER